LSKNEWSGTGAPSFFCTPVAVVNGVDTKDDIVYTLKKERNPHYHTTPKSVKKSTTIQYTKTSSRG
ncbi:hypothetical protein L9G15_27330, partial [Shewanella sp. A3A]|nr:hypothetical protein [Shewanella ferrihydritica]